jgi:hypothetical protein
MTDIAQSINSHYWRALHLHQNTESNNNGSLNKHNILNLYADVLFKVSRCLLEKQFEDTKRVTTAVNGKKDLQHNDQKKKVQKTICKTYT